MNHARVNTRHIQLRISGGSKRGREGSPFVSFCAHALPADDRSRKRSGQQNPPPPPPPIKNSRSATDYLTTPRTTTLLKATYPGGDWHPCHTIDQFSLFSRYAIFTFSSYIFTPLRSLPDRCFWWLTSVSRLPATSLKPSSTACSRPEDSAIAELTFLQMLSSPSVWNQV